MTIDAPGQVMLDNKNIKLNTHTHKIKKLIEQLWICTKPASCCVVFSLCISSGLIAQYVRVTSLSEARLKQRNRQRLYVCVRNDIWHRNYIQVINLPVFRILGGFIFTWP